MNQSDLLILVAELTAENMRLRKSLDSCNDYISNLENQLHTCECSHPDECNGACQ